MRYRALISIFLLITVYCPIAKGQSFNEVPVTLANYTFNNDNIKSGKLTGLIFPKEKNITLSAKDAKWLFIKDNSIFIKNQFVKTVLKKKEINFTIILKKEGKMSEVKTFTLLSDQFKSNKVIAHRGAWKALGLPENSIASLKAAISLGCFGSETDLHMTADSALVINHDNEWGGLSVQKSTLADLQKTKLSNGESLPLLQDF